MDAPRENPLLFLRNNNKKYCIDQTVVFIKTVVSNLIIYKVFSVLPSYRSYKFLPCHMLHLLYFFFIVTYLKTLQNFINKKQIPFFNFVTIFFIIFLTGKFVVVVVPQYFNAAKS